MNLAYLALSSMIISLVAIFFSFIVGWLNRKLIAHFQHRVGPFLAGPHGILQEFADFIKLMSKEVVEPAGSDSFLMDISPVLAVAALLYAMLFIPFTSTKGLLGFSGDLIFLIALETIITLLILLTGYASVGPFATVGTGRLGEQVISYEIPFASSMIAAMIVAGTATISEIVRFQSNVWIIVLNPIAFIVFIIGLLGEFHVQPFAPPVVETEIAAGYEVEVSARRLAFFKLAHNIELLWFSLLGAILFLGGPQPLIPGYEWLGIIWISLKALFIIFIVSLLESVFATYRIDQVVRIFWKWYIPLGIVSILLSVFVRFYVF